jgi:AcrR family transcriptional regulator
MMRRGPTRKGGVVVERARRRRLPAEEARRRILEAAERRLVEGGPQALRLTDVARDLGLTHQAILHHFESREGLLQELAASAMAALSRDLVEALGGAGDRPLDPRELLDGVFDTFGRRGHGRLLAWLFLSGLGERPDPAPLEMRRIAEALHERRRADGESVPFEETLFAVLLAGFAAFGDAIAGEAMRRSAGLAGDAHAESRFRDWFARVMVEQLR